MAPLNPNNTVRLWVMKSGVSGQHETMFRFPAETTALEATTAAFDVLTETAPLLWAGDTWIQARFSEAGSDLSFPTDWTPIVGTNVGTWSEDQNPKFVSFVGRGSLGRRVRWTIQGAPFTPNDDYRILASASTAVNNVITALSDPANNIVDISGAAPIVNPYANLGYNAYFQRKERRV